jgi:hypothetical protein
VRFVGTLSPLPSSGSWGCSTALSTLSGVKRCRHRNGTRFQSKVAPDPTSLGSFGIEQGDPSNKHSNVKRLETSASDLQLREVLDLSTANDLKELIELIPNLKLKAPRKNELVQTLCDHVLGSGLIERWNQLSGLEQSAVAEAVFDADGVFPAYIFAAKYGSFPAFESKGENSWAKRPTALRLFLYRDEEGCHSVPRDLREKLRSFVPKPAPAQLVSWKELPALPPRVRDIARYDVVKKMAQYESHEVPLVERPSETAAVQDLRTLLRLIDQGKIAVSDKTLFPSKATMTLLKELLSGGDYFDPNKKLNKSDPEIGPIKAFSWPLLVQAGHLASIRKGELTLTKQGRAALESDPAHTLRDLWKSWISNTLIDEFTRIDAIKGQSGKGSKGFTPLASRRSVIASALSRCPVGQWVETSEFSRYMQAAGFLFDVTLDTWSLYLLDPKYGSLGYGGSGGWNILQERYLLCLLFEYAAPLGLIDIAYEDPGGARMDYGGLWGSEDLVFLSRYDGLRYFRVTPLGAYLLGIAESYVAKTPRQNLSLTVLPKRQVRVNEGELSPDQILLLESFADPETTRLWSLNESKAIRAVEKGANVGELRDFLSASDPQPLPESVDSFLRSSEERGAACVCKGTRLLIECLTPQIADTLAQDSRIAAFSQRTGDRGLIIPMDKEHAFRQAINSLNLGMPRI